MRKLHRFLLVGVAPVCILAAAAGEALAWNTNTNNCSNNAVQPYRGGAGVSRFFTAPDGAGVTITSTGAVIKQSPCGTPYREGWVNPKEISGIYSFSSIPKLQSGAANPYTTKIYKQPLVITPSSGGSAASASTTANASASATVNVTSSVGAVANTSKAASPQTQTSSSLAAASSTSAKSPATLPNTGPGNIFAIGGLTTAVSAIGHFLFKTLRYRFMG